MELNHKLRRTITREEMFSPGDRVLCAVSGGADSTALLLLLSDLAPSLGITLSAAHLNHCLRGAESDRDEAFVRDLCARLGIPLYVRRADISALASLSGKGIEACAREIRYAFFREVMEENGIKCLATAHTARDNLETAVFHLIRGTGVAGLAGIPAVRRMGPFRIIRPLLDVSREEIEAYLRERGESYVTDSSNGDDSYTRNYIRLHVLPELEMLNPSLYETASTTQRRLREDADFIAFAVEEAYGKYVRSGTMDAKALSSLHPAVAGRLIARIWREIAPEGEELTSANCEEVLSLPDSVSPSAFTDLPGGVRVRREYGRLRFLRAIDETPRLLTRMLKIGGATAFPEAGLEIICETGPNLSQNYGFIHKFFFDYARICGILSVRSRREGDSILLAGHDHTKTLKKAMIDAKVPRFRRDLIPVICDEQGIVAVDGLGVAARAAVTDKTQNVLCIRIITTDGGNGYDDGIR